MICSQVSFTVTALSGAKLDEAEKAPGGLLKKFKLESSMATSNMNFFDSGGVAIERYATPFDICKAFYKVRLETYAKRKARTRRPLTRRWHPPADGVRIDRLHAVEATTALPRRRGRRPSLCRESDCAYAGVERHASAATSHRSVPTAGAPR